MRKKDETLKLFGKTFRQLFVLAEAPTAEMQVALMRLATREFETPQGCVHLGVANN